MPRGGRRQGAPGKNYANRSDMQLGTRQPPIMRAPSQRYGEQAEQVRAQQAIPMAPQPAIPPAAPAAPTTQPIPLGAPTMRPDEPLTAGVNIGPGPGAPAPAVQNPDDPLVQELRAMYLAFPSEDLRELLEDYDTGRTF